MAYEPLEICFNMSVIPVLRLLSYESGLATSTMRIMIFGPKSTSFLQWTNRLY